MYSTFPTFSIQNVDELYLEYFIAVLDHVVQDSGEPIQFDSREGGLRGGPNQVGSEHQGQTVGRHLVFFLMLSHRPEEFQKILKNLKLKH